MRKPQPMAGSGRSARIVRRPPQDFSQRPVSSTAKPAASAPSPAENFDAIDWASVEREGVELRQSFAVAFPRDQVWRFFADLDQVTRCMPGARLTKPSAGQPRRGRGQCQDRPDRQRVSRRALDVARDDNQFRGMVRGCGPRRQEPVERAGHHSIRGAIDHAISIAGRCLGEIPAVRRAGAVQPFGAGQGCRGPSDPRVSRRTSKPGCPAVRLPRKPPRRSMPPPSRAPALRGRIAGFFRRFWNG